jgi:membrane protease subunit HflK
MGWQDEDDRKKKKKNPWGGEIDNGGRNPWGGSGSHGNGEPPPDLDEMLRRAQDNFKNVIPQGIGGGRFLLLGVLGLIALWLASGLFIVVPGENGVIQRFGAWSRTQANEGLGYHLPWPVESVTKVNVTEVRRLGIGFVERYSRAGAASKQDLPDESLMLTSDANIVDLDMEVQWNIKSAEQFLFNIKDQENTIKKVAESAIREVVGQTQMFPIITQARTEVAQRVREIMVQNLDQYQSGVNIMQVLIQQAEVHPDVQDAFQDVQSAKQDAEDVQNRAGAYREDILPKARGKAIQMKQGAEAYKQTVIARAKGDADRFNSVYNAYLKGQDVTKKRIYIETMENVLQNAQKIILDQNGEGSGVVPYLPLNELKPAAGSSAEIPSDNKYQMRR